MGRGTDDGRPSDGRPSRWSSSSMGPRNSDAQRLSSGSGTPKTVAQVLAARLSEESRRSRFSSTTFGRGSEDLGRLSDLSGRGSASSGANPEQPAPRSVGFNLPESPAGKKNQRKVGLTSTTLPQDDGDGVSEFAEYAVAVKASEKWFSDDDLRWAVVVLVAVNVAISLKLAFPELRLGAAGASAATGLAGFVLGGMTHEFRQSQDAASAQAQIRDDFAKLAQSGEEVTGLDIVGALDAHDAAVGARGDLDTVKWALSMKHLHAAEASAAEEEKKKAPRGGVGLKRSDAKRRLVAPGLSISGAKSVRSAPRQLSHLGTLSTSSTQASRSLARALSHHGLDLDAVRLVEDDGVDVVDALSAGLVEAWSRSEALTSFEQTLDVMKCRYLATHQSFDRLIWQLAGVGVVLLAFGDDLVGRFSGLVVAVFMAFQAFGHISYALTKHSPGNGKLEASWYTILRVHDLLTCFLASHHPVFTAALTTTGDSTFRLLTLILLTLNTCWHIAKIQEDILMQMHGMNYLDAFCHCLGVFALLAIDHDHVVRLPFFLGTLGYIALHRYDRVW